jgi:hypothetical protein
MSRQTRQKLWSEVFRDLLFWVLHFGPPPPPSLLGIERFGAHDNPPTTCDEKGGVRVVMRIQLVGGVRGRRRAGAGHGRLLGDACRGGKG